MCIRDRHYPKVRQSLLMISGSSGRRIAYDDILYIESRRMNLRVVCSKGVEHTIRKKLDDVQEELPENRFLRCNQSFIVNMDYIRDADNNFTMCNGDIIPIKAVSYTHLDVYKRQRFVRAHWPGVYPVPQHSVYRSIAKKVRGG